MQYSAGSPERGCGASLKLVNAANRKPHQNGIQKHLGGYRMLALTAKFYYRFAISSRALCALPGL
jgi:hypothetical protein